VPKILRCEFTLGPPRAEQGLVGSGLIVVNPPYPLEQDLRLVLPALGRLLAPQGGHRLDWLAPAG
jgi:23S rRNA (adenine2030-N6)-methyltransferase